MLISAHFADTVPGKPGTGKSTMAFSLAGHFDLSIYTVSLLDSDLSDSALAKMMIDLPTKSLVLLEDLDSCGIDREVSHVSETKDAKDKKDTKGTEKSEKSEKDSSDAKTKSSGSKVTLSGLLNAIDGPHSPEGHILIMTTNTPDVLEEALTRPGRIDLETEFDYAGRQQVRDMFVRMYEQKQKPLSPTLKLTTVGRDANKDADRNAETVFEHAELAELADKFASRVPEREFSSAQFQEFLVPRKRDPKGAAEEIDVYIEKLRERKARKAGAQIEEVGEGEKGQGAEGKGKASEVKCSATEAKGTQTESAAEAATSSADSAAVDTESSATDPGKSTTEGKGVSSEATAS
jgi:mitochondrial chaperone BCS1